MKKYISFLVVLAMLLTTLAFPAAVFATEEEVLPAGTGNEAITITYAVKSNDGTQDLSEVHPGEAFKLVVSGKVTEAQKITAFSLGVPFDDTNFTANKEGITYGTLFASAGIVANAVPGKGINLFYEQNETGIDVSNQSEAFEIATIPFTVNADAAAAPSYKFGEELIANKGQENISFIEMTGLTEIFDYTVGSTQATLAVVANTVSVTVDGAALTEGKTYYKVGGVSLGVTGTGITKVTLQKDAEEAVDHTGKYDVISVPATGAYKLTVTTAEGDKVFNFSVFAEEISAAVNVTADPTAVKKGASFQLKAAMSEINGPAGAAMVSFDAAYDPAVITFNNADLGAGVPAGTDAVKVVDDKNGKLSVIYGDKNSNVEENAVTKDEEFVVLNFTVKNEVAAETTSTAVNLTNAKAAMFNTAPSAIDFAVTINSPVTVTIAPDTLMDTPVYPEQWSNAAYDLDVIVYGTAKYAAAVDVPNEQDALNWVKENGTDVNGKINVAKEGNYYVVVTPAAGEAALFTLNAADLKLDLTGPEITFTGVSDSWRKGAQIDVTSLNATDKGAGMAEAVEYFYYLGTTDDGAQVTNAVSGGAIAVEDGTAVDTITFKAADKLGNTSVKTFSVKVDNAKPVVKFEKAEGTQKPAASVTLNLTVTDAGSGIPAAAIVVKKDGEDSGKSITLEGGSGSVVVNENGTYSVVVKDNVENTAAEASVTVNEIEGAVVPALKAAVNSAAATKAGLKTDDEMKKAGFADNGTYKYLKVEADTTAAGYTTKVVVVKDSEPALPEAASYELTEAGKYVITLTTTANNNPGVTASAVYTVNIAADLPSVNGDKVYNVADYAVMKMFVGKTAEPTAGVFKGGYFAGDVNGDFANNADDYAAMLNALKNMAGKSEYGKYFEIAK